MPSPITLGLRKAMKSPQYFQAVPVIIELHPDAKFGQFTSGFSGAFGADIGKTIPYMNMFSTYASKDMIYQIAGFSEVKAVYHDRQMFAFGDPLGLFSSMSDSLPKTMALPLRLTQDGMIPTAEAIKRVNIPKLHSQGATGKGVKVMVLDTGVNPAAPQIYGKIADMHSETGEPPLDGNGHSTHCISTIVGKYYEAEPTGYPMMGGAPDCTMYADKVLTNPGFGNTSDILAGMQRALDMKTDIVSMSLGGEVTSAEEEQADPMVQFIQKAAQTHPKTLFAIAAGNSGPDPKTVGTPGAAHDAICVAAWGIIDDHVAYFSSRGPTWSGEVRPDIAGCGGGRAVEGAKPSETIYSTTSFGSILDSVCDSHLSDGYASMAGTSMATPQVASVLALWKQMMPELTVKDIKKIFTVFGNKNKNTETGWGLINADWINQAMQLGW